MNLEQAFEARVSLNEAIHEIETHGVFVDFDGRSGEIFDPVTEETVVMPDREGLYSGSEILAWLGY